MINRRRENKITKALVHIKSGLRYRQASRKYGNPISTLHHGMTSPLQKLVGKCALSVQQETHIAQFFLRYAQRGILLTLEHLRGIISSVIAAYTPAERLMIPFKKDSPSDGYLHACRRRHADKLKFTRPLMQEAKRFSDINVETLTTHFCPLEKLILDNNVDEYRIFNLDEVGISPGDASGKLVCCRFTPRNGSQEYMAARLGYEDRITMMPVISAAGLTGPPLFVIKGKRIVFKKTLLYGNILTETPADCLPTGAV